MKKAFTLAEVLLTLAVIGIVAAITLPSLLVDTTEKAFDAQKRALHARLAQAIGMMSTLSGYGQYVEEVKNEDGTIKTEGKDDAAETFLYEGLSKVYKMNNICDSENLDKCGIPSTITKMDNSTMDFPKTIKELNPNLENDWNKLGINPKAAAFETINGESVAVFYNPHCINKPESTWYYTQNTICVNFIYDLNGAKGPNKVGRDIGFISAIGNKNPEVVAPIPFEKDASKAAPFNEALEICKNYSDDSRLPNVDEAASMFYNSPLFGDSDEYNVKDVYWTSTAASSTNAWYTSLLNGTRRNVSRTENRRVRCVKK